MLLVSLILFLVNSITKLKVWETSHTSISITKSGHYCQTKTTLIISIDYSWEGTWR